MVRSFPVDLMALINHIQLQYEKVIANKSFDDRMCFCKKEIFTQFTYGVEKVVIKLGARTLKFLEDYNLELSTDLTGLREWFESEIYESLYENERVSNKMVLIFELLQKYQDKKFFDLIEKKYSKILIYLKEDKETGVERELNEMFDEIRAWYELFLYMILATQFNCQSFSPNFLEAHNVAFDVVPADKRCVHDGDCDVHEKIGGNGEQVNIIMTNDFIDDTTWLNKLMDIVSNYHVDPAAVTLILDYRMYDHLVQCKLSDRHYDKLIETNKHFKNMMIKNHEGINFNGHFESIKHLIE